MVGYVHRDSQKSGHGKDERLSQRRVSGARQGQASESEILWIPRRTGSKGTRNFEQVESGSEANEQGRRQRSAHRGGSAETEVGNTTALELWLRVFTSDLQRNEDPGVHRGATSEDRDRVPIE